MKNYRIYVENTEHSNAIVSCGSLYDAEKEFKACNSIDGGTTYLQAYCPLIGWGNLKLKSND